MKKKFNCKKFLSFILIITLIVSNVSLSATSVEVDCEEISDIETPTLEIATDITSDTVDTILSETLSAGDIEGEYYINNISSGKFLRRATAYSVTTSLFEDTSDIRWIFDSIGDGNFYIRSATDSEYGLLSLTDSPELGIVSCSLPYMWSVESAYGGGVIIKSVYNDVVLTCDGTTVEFGPEVTSTALNYSQTVWGVVKEDNYVNLTDFSLGDDWLLPNSSKHFGINADATWSSNSCFNWSIQSNGTPTKNVFTVDSGGNIYASQYGGTATLTVTHKMTGLTKTFTIKSGEFRDGIYAIMNKSTGRYMDIEGPSTAAGAYIQQWDYHTGDQARWRIEMLAGGFYSIKSVYSNKWLKAGSDTDSTAIIQGSTLGTPGAKWYVTKTSSGSYKLSPSNNESSSIRVPLNANDNGTNLTLSTYTNNSNYRDEWMFYNSSFSYTVNHYYDIGFTVRFSGLTSDHGALIASYQNVVSEKFLKIFNLHTTYTYSPFNSTADLCKVQQFGSITVSNCSAGCSHSQYHLTPSVLRDDLPTGMPTSSTCIWTGHLLGDERSNSLTGAGWHSVVITPSLNTSEEEIYCEYTNVLMHELSHQLNAPDHYCYGDYKDNGKCSNPVCDECVYGQENPRTCLMGMSYYDHDILEISDENIYCSSCTLIIKDHLKNHH